MEIKPYAKNGKKHPKKQIEQIANSIKEFGMHQPIVVDKEGVIIVGHGRYEALKHLGMEVPKDMIRVADLTDEQAKAYRLADNKLNESEWDMNLVIEELKDLSEPMLELTGFDKDLIIEADEMDDVVPVVPEDPQSKLGDLYELGNHRVLCGDSTKIEDMERLMVGVLADIVVTDPPYNTGMQGKNTTFDYDWSKQKKNEKARLSHMFDDNYTPEEWATFLTDVFGLYTVHTKGDCAFYVFIDWRRVNDIRSEMEKHMDVKNVIVWDKKVHGLGSDYKSTYELCIVGKKGKPEINNRYGLDYQDIWRLQREMGRNKDHATAKPVELLEKPIKHASKADDIVLDLFLGSGSTLIASEKTGRVCYGMELDPRYISVILDRWQQYTGKEPILVETADPTDVRKGLAWSAIKSSMQQETT
jgi:site-specific DNA-methyltransferase (adenine-specific)